MAAIFFLFLGAKKLPKKPVLFSGCKSNDGLAARGGTCGGSGLPVFGSTWVGLAALCRSLTIAIACVRCVRIKRSHVRDDIMSGEWSESAEGNDK